MLRRIFLKIHQTIPGSFTYILPKKKYAIHPNYTPSTSEINFDGKTATKDEEIAAMFNEYFSTVGNMLSKAIKDCDTDPLS